MSKKNNRNGIIKKLIKEIISLFKKDEIADGAFIELNNAKGNIDDVFFIREELIRLGNFTIYGLRDAFGHLSKMSVTCVGSHWTTIFDDDTTAYRWLKEFIGMSDTNVNYNEYEYNIYRWLRFLETNVPCINFGKYYDLMMDALNEYNNILEEFLNKPTEEEEKKTLDDMKREQEMRDELKNIQENGK